MNDSEQDVFSQAGNEPELANEVVWLGELVAAPGISFRTENTSCWQACLLVM